MGVTIVDNTQTVNNATWKVQTDVITDETGIVKEDGTIHFYNGKLKYHSGGVIKEVGVGTDFAISVKDVITTLPVAYSTIGDRFLYINSLGGIVEWNGDFWEYVFQNGTTPIGTLVINTKNNVTYKWSGSAWDVYSSQTSVSTPVIDVITTLPVSYATTGDKFLYINSLGGVVEWNGDFWEYVFQNATTPTGTLVTNTKNNVTYRWSGSSWDVYNSQKVLDLTLSRKTDDYTLVAADNGQVVEMNKATANTLTVPSGVFSAGQQVLITQYGAGQTTIVGSGVTLRSDGGKLKINAQYSMATILFISATEAYVSGNLAL